MTFSPQVGTVQIGGKYICFRPLSILKIDDKIPIWANPYGPGEYPGKNNLTN